ncbi:MAG TPA: metallophosphoesterase [Candidatus Omnitrophota bacterium]|nr:metallophosphoesterase [Candidatus Omnitrophota bacterium]
MALNVNVMSNKLPLTIRMWNGIKNLVGRGPATAQMQISAAYPNMTAPDLLKPLTVPELYKLNQAIAMEKGDGKFFTRDEALIKFNPRKEIVAVGDLHGNIARLDRLVNDLGPRLASGEIVLTFLGDAIHPEKGDDKKLRDMSASIATLNTIINLKKMYPDRVHFLIGNHDVVNPKDQNAMGFTKGGVPQALVFLTDLQKYFRSQGYSGEDTEKMVAGYQNFFDSCAVSATVEGSKYAVLLAHSAVVKGGVKQEQLIKARENPGLLRQLLWNTYRLRSSNMADVVYKAKDVIDTIKLLNFKVPEQNVYLISGHTPDDKGFVHQPFPGMNHFIVHGNVENSFGVLVIKDGLPQGMVIKIDPQIANAA